MDRLTAVLLPASAGLASPRPIARALLLRLAPAVLAIAITVTVLVPPAQTLPQHEDEMQYIWSAGYFGARLARLDFSPAGTDALTDPGWNPMEYWAVTQPMGARLVYAAAMALGGVPPPAQPYEFDDRSTHGKASAIPARTLPVVRGAAVFTAALAFAVFALRFGWPGLLVSALLALPHARDDLARAWAEAPLLFGLALCAATFRTRWFAAACGLAATFKITALAVWPLVFLFHPIGRSRLARTLGLLPTAVVWTALTPPSWYAGGPIHLGFMLVNRAGEHAGQSAEYGGPFGLFFPPRYLIPVEVALLLALCIGVRWAAPRLAVRGTRLATRLSPGAPEAPTAGPGAVCSAG